MKRTALLFILGLAVLLAGSGTAMAVSTDEKKLEQEIEDLNQRGRDDQGHQQVVRELEQEFSVSESQVTSLRDRKLGYGEIAVVFSLAKKMPGGITDDNVSRIMTMRQGPPTMGWGRIAQELGSKLGPVVSEVKHVNRESRGEMKKDQSSSGSMSREKHEVKDKEQQRELRQERMKHDSMARGKEKEQGRGR
jgi:hypothetical protein